MSEPKKVTPIKDTAKADIDYKKLYTDECAKTKSQAVKIEELDKLCKAYAENAQKMTEALQRAAIEYDARINYMLDSVKHAYLSMQFAVNASDKSKGGKQ